MHRWLQQGQSAVEESYASYDDLNATVDESYNGTAYAGGEDSYYEEDTYSKSYEPLDYSVLSVGVMTLGLILFVEVSRHTLDHAAHHKPFFKTVLEMVYSECKSMYAPIFSGPLHMMFTLCFSTTDTFTLQPG